MDGLSQPRLIPRTPDGNKNVVDDMEADQRLLSRIVGQFGTRQFSTGQFGSKIIKRTTWHQDNKNRQFGTKMIKTDNLAPK